MSSVSKARTFGMNTGEYAYIIQQSIRDTSRDGDNSIGHEGDALDMEAVVVEVLAELSPNMATSAAVTYTTRSNKGGGNAEA